MFEVAKVFWEGFSQLMLLRWMPPLPPEEDLPGEPKWAGGLTCSELALRHFNGRIAEGFACERSVAQKRNALCSSPRF